MQHFTNPPLTLKLAPNKSENLINQVWSNDLEKSLFKLSLQNNTEYPLEEINQRIQDLNSTSYDFLGHKLKVLQPIADELKCKKCLLDPIDIFIPSRRLCLLSCSGVRHINHAYCTEKRMINVICPTCAGYSGIIDIYNNATSYLNDIVLACTNEGCYFITKYKNLQNYNYKNLQLYFDQLVEDGKERLRMHVFLQQPIQQGLENLKSFVVSSFRKKIYNDGLISLSTKPEFKTIVESAIYYDLNAKTINTELQINMKPIQNFITNINESCPYPLTKFNTERAEGFLLRNHKFLIDFLYERIIEKSFLSSYRHSCANRLKKNNKKQIDITYNNNAIIIDTSHITNVPRKLKALEYKSSVIEVGETAADAFARLQLKFNIDIAIIDLIYNPYLHLFSEYTDAHFHLEWDALEDYILMTNGTKIEKLSLSAFINKQTGIINFELLKLEIEKHGFNCDELNRFCK